MDIYLRAGFHIRAFYMRLTEKVTTPERGMPRGWSLIYAAFRSLRFRRFAIDEAVE